MNKNELSYRKCFYDRYVNTHTANKLSKASLEESLQPRSPFLKKIINQHFPASMRSKIIDIGCGDASLLYFAKKMGFTDLTGYDISPEQIHRAKSIGFNNIHQKGAKEALNDLTENSIDLIISFDVIEHLTKSEAVDLAQSVHRVLKPNGKWLIHTLNAESPFFGRIRYGDFTHENGFTKESVKQFLTVCNFTSVACFEDTPTIHGLKSLFRFLIWKFLRNIFRLALAAETGEKNGIFSQNFIVTAIKNEQS